MKLSAILGGLMLTAVVAGLMITNPSPEAYTRYATTQAGTYFANELCNDVPPEISSLLGGRCAEIVQTLQPQLEAIVRDRTERLNLGIASIYRTTFGIREFSFLPEYRAETLGILNRFITYRIFQTP